jgi:phosphate-selective porin OprO/OprP
MRDGSRVGGAALVRSARWTLTLAMLAGLGMTTTVRSQDLNSSAFDQLKQMVERQQEQIRQLQAQVATNNQQQPIAAAPQLGQIPAQPTGYDAAPAAAAGAPPTPGAGLPPGATIVTNEKTPLSAYWNNGVVVESANKEFTVHLGGRMEWDAGTYEAPQSSVLALRALNNSPTSPGIANGWQDFQNNMDFRRARLRADGTIYENIDFICEFEFAGSFAVVRPNRTGPGGTLNTGVANSTIANANNLINAVTPTWVECTVKDIPIVGNVMTGQFLVPFSFDLATSDEYTQFIERSAAFDAFVPQSGQGNFAQGVEFFDWNEEQTVTWRNALTANTENDPFNAIALGNDNFSWIGRLTWLPYYDEASGGRYLVHVGIDGQAQQLERDVINFHDRGDVHPPYAIAPSYINQNVAGTSSEMLGTEFVTVLGPWCLESEYYAMQVDGSNINGTAKGTFGHFFDGGYIQVTYFLTGENMTYVRKAAAFTRVTPYENFFNLPGERTHCGLGAWQVGARYSWVDLNDQGVHGGFLNETTAGVNWYMNPNLRYEFNYCYTRVVDLGAAGSTISANGFGARMTMNF